MKHVRAHSSPLLPQKKPLTAVNRLTPFNLNCVNCVISNCNYTVIYSTRGTSGNILCTPIRLPSTVLWPVANTNYLYTNIQPNKCFSFFSVFCWSITTTTTTTNTFWLPVCTAHVSHECYRLSMASLFAYLFPCNSTRFYIFIGGSLWSCISAWHICQ